MRKIREFGASSKSLPKQKPTKPNTVSVKPKIIAERIAQLLTSYKIRGHECENRRDDCLECRMILLKDIEMTLTRKDKR